MSIEKIFSILITHYSVPNKRMAVIMRFIKVSIKITMIGLGLLILFYAWKHLWVEEQIRTIDEFEELHIGGLVNVYLKQGPKEALKVRADQKFIDQIKSEVKNAQLHIYTEGRIRGERIMEVEITYTSLTKIKTQGVGTLVSTNFIQSDDLILDIGGAPEVKLKVNTDSLQLQMQGTGNVQLAGSTKIFDLNIYGFGDLVAYNLESEKARVRINTPDQSKGIARIQVLSELDAEIVGPRFLYYAGNPQVLNEKIVGSGKIVKK